jgi:hypothetical protein
LPLRILWMIKGRDDLRKAWYVRSPRSRTMILLSSVFDLHTNWTCKAIGVSGIRKRFRSINIHPHYMIFKLNQEQELWLELSLSSNYCGRNSWPRQNNDLTNYEQRSKSLDQEHIYQEKARLELITRNRNKAWVQPVLTRVRDNVPRLFIYTLDIYSTFLAAQAIFKAVAWASSLLSFISINHCNFNWLVHISL